MRAHPEIDALLTELLDSGVSPKYISRLASELEDHYSDLEAEARRLGVPESEAADDARSRLGAGSVIAKEFACRPELRSWVYTCVWVQWLLQVVGAAYVLVSAPARAVAGGHGVMLRYTAATAAGTSITCAILLMLTAIMSPESTWGARLAEQAGAALGAWQLDRATRRRGPPLIVTQAPPPRHDAAQDGAGTPADPSGARAPAAGQLEVAVPGPSGAAQLTTRSVVHAPQLPVPTYRLAQSRPLLDDAKVRITLTELEPAAHLGIDDQDLRPVTEAAPIYPWAAARRGLEGQAVVEYTVTQTGTVRDAVVVESSHPLFERAALEAAETLTYHPRTIRGQPVDVRGVRILIRFELEA